MEYEKELRALYLKGYHIGHDCKVALTENIGHFDDDLVYEKLASKGDVVNAKIVKQNNIPMFEITINDKTVYAFLTVGKGR